MLWHFELNIYFFLLLDKRDKTMNTAHWPKNAWLNVLLISSGYNVETRHIIQMSTLPVT